MSVCLHKGFTKDVLRARGIATPDSAVIEQAAQCDALTLAPPLFVKPVAEGTGKGVTPQGIVHRREDLAAVCASLIERYRQPVLVESYLPGREFTVGVLGTGARARVLGALEVVLLPGAQLGVYSYENKEHCEELVEYRLATDATARRAEAVALAAWRAIGGRDVGRIDLRCDQMGAPHLLEINPLPGMHPQHSDLPILCTQIGMPYEELVGAIIDSACERVAPLRSSHYG
jgi:D-alanine-D-alanine ligase